MSNFLGSLQDDLDKKLEQVIFDLIAIVTKCYETAFKDGKGTVTSVSNFFKTDSKYCDLAKEVLTYFNLGLGEDLIENWDIFKH